MNMQIKKYKFKVALLSAIFFLSGCSQSFLDTTPEGSIPVDSFYKTDADAKGAVLGVYDILQSMYAYDWDSMWMLKTLLSDEIYTGGGHRGDQPPYEEINEFRYSSSNPVITWLFQMSYWGIYRANLVIANIKPESDAKKQAIAEAKSLRAMLYFDLVTLWGQVPLVTEPASSPDQYNQPRAKVADIWAQIEKDLNEAIPDLPLKSQQSAADKVRVSKGMAQAMLGKSLLYEKKYADAAAEFQKVIDSGEYGLISDYSQVLRKGQEFGKESLFEISYSAEKNYDWGNFQWGNNGRNTESNIHWQLCGPRGDGWFDGGNTGLVAGWGFAYPQKSLWNAYTAANDTVRRNAAMMSEDQLIAHGGKLRNADQGNSYPWECEGYVRLKYGSWADESNTSATSVKELNYATNVRLMRYADVLLMAAEAYNRSGQDGKALPLINQVRARVNLPALTSSGDQLFADIKNERRLELSFEGVRFQDLVRWGDAKSVLADQGKMIPEGTFTNGQEDYMSISGAGFKDKNVLLPIPEQEISVNPQSSQNDGY
ncbi:membrane protein [Prolixibacter denitrificans]|uniref:Membrane protein n=2 Tax=Prolixibacter denitrificans TaxID=1541063 RepID=A0ABQ0ZK85_9BACT|nr:membrane protein [Prolixibacter denitrificans]